MQPGFWDDGVGSRSFWERQGQTILVTGAYSYLGFRVVERLSSAGWTVRVLTAPEQMGVVKLPRRVIECPGSLADVASLQAAVRDCRKVVHLAERTLGSDPESYRLENVEWLRNMVQASREAGVQQLVLLSSAHVDHRQPNAYGRSKKIAEDVLRGSGVPWVILRPTVVAGPDGCAEFRWMRAVVRRFSVLPLPDGGHAVKRPVHEEDLAEGIDLLLRADPTQTLRRVFHLAGKQAFTVHELARMIARENHLPPRWIVPVPGWVLAICARFADRYLKPPFPLTQALQSLVHDCDPDIGLAVEVFGYRPRPLAGRLLAAPPRPGLRPHAPIMRVLHRLSLVRR